MMKRSTMAIALAIALGAPATAQAQSLFGTRGLGVPAEGLDARARGLATNGVGLLGLSTSLTNPAETAGLLRRGVSASFQPWGGSTEYAGEEDELSATRFPLLRIIYPTRLGVFSLGYAGVLEQSWAVFADGQEIVGNDTVATRDLVQSIGGLGQLRLGIARNVSDNFALGLAVGLYTGNVDRAVLRQFPDSSLEFSEFETHQRWSYSAPLVSVGMLWDPMTDLRFGASATWGGTLTAKPTEGSTTEYEYDMPIRFHVGASGRVARGLVAAVSGSWTAWTSDDYRTPGTNTATPGEQQMEIGAGLEYEDLRAGERVFPLRLGVRTSKLPFHLVNEEAPTEWAITGGLGFRLVQDEFGPLAVADVGFERATREGLVSPDAPNGLKESFWRLTVSVALFGR